MKRKKKEINQEIPIKISFYNTYKNKINISMLLIVLSIFGGWRFYIYTKAKEGIKQYETMMNKREYHACLFVDEDGVTVTYYSANDPNQDHKGIDTMHIPMIRAFYWTDGYGESKPIPCREAKTQEEINICNSRYLYLHLDTGIIPDDIDGANPALVKNEDNTISHDDRNSTKKSY